LKHSFHGFYFYGLKITRITSKSVDYPLFQALKEVGASPCYASQIVSRKREPSLPLAVKILDETGYEIEPLADRTAEEITILKQASKLLYEN
jgi:hypothetical protein